MMLGDDAGPGLGPSFLAWPGDGGDLEAPVTLLIVTIGSGGFERSSSLNLFLGTTGFFSSFSAGFSGSNRSLSLFILITNFPSFSSAFALGTTVTLMSEEGSVFSSSTSCSSFSFISSSTTFFFFLSITVMLIPLDNRETGSILSFFWSFLVPAISASGSTSSISSVAGSEVVRSGFNSSSLISGKTSASSSSSTFSDCAFIMSSVISISSSKTSSGSSSMFVSAATSLLGSL